MERIDINKEYNFYELSKLKHQNRQEIGTLPIHEFNVDRYVTLISFYPFSEKKEKVFKSLNKAQKMGMLNRHVLSVARKIGMSNILINKAKEITKDLAKAKKNAKNKNLHSYFKPKYYKEEEIIYRRKLEEYYGIILNMIIEEMQRRMDVKYLRKKKLDEIIQLSTD